MNFISPTTTTSTTSNHNAINRLHCNNTSSLKTPQAKPKARSAAGSSSTTPRCSIRRRPTMTTPSRRRRRLNQNGSFSSSSCTMSPSLTQRRVVHGDDRFIPNRSRIDTPRLRQALVDSSFVQEHRDDAHHQEESSLPFQTENKQDLRRVLFGDDTSSGDSLLGLAGGTNCYTQRGMLLNANMTKPCLTNPMNLDILRSPWKSYDGNRLAAKSRSRHRKVDLTKEFTLDMTGMDPRDHLHVMSVGPRIAVGIEDTVAFDEWGVPGGDMEAAHWADHRTTTTPHLAPLQLEHMGQISALKWRYPADEAGGALGGNRYVLAVGGEDSVQVYNVARGDCLAELTNHMDTITSLEWIHHTTVGNEFELLAASSMGIQRYDLRLPMPEVFTYNTCLGGGYGRDSAAARMQLQPHNGHLLAAAIPDKDFVGIWDLRYSSIPMQTLEHGNVKDLEFCPLHRNTLASGGQNGVKLWNVQASTERSAFETHRPVSCLTWSPHRIEVLAGFGQYLGLWAVSDSFTKATKLEQWMQPQVGPVVAVERLNNPSGTVLSLHGDASGFGEEGQEMMIGWKAFGSTARPNPPKEDQEIYGMTLSSLSPVIRAKCSVAKATWDSSRTKLKEIN